MKHNKYPKNEKKTPRKLLSKALGKLATAEQKTHVELSRANLAGISGLLLGREGSRRNIGKAREQQTYRDNLLREPLVSVSLGNGQQEGLTHLIFMGETVLSVTRIINHDKTLAEASISVLPIGINAEQKDGTRNLSARKLLSLDVEAVKKPGPDGVVQRWRELHVSREGLKQAFGVEDRQVSAAHAKIGLDSEGGFDIQDSSTNGTQILSIEDFSSSGENSALREGAIGVIKALESEPYLWSGQYADQKVVLP